MSRLLIYLGLLAGLVLCPRGRPGEPTSPAPVFELPQRGTNRIVKLADFTGQIVVLDFFAYWCAPCERSSGEVEQQLREHYATRGGNPQGIPVEVLAINVEPAQAGRTDAFIRKHRLARVLDDERGKTLKAYGGRGLPFFVILDGTRATRENPSFQVLYRHAGFEGTPKLRRLIDAITRPGSTNDGPGLGQKSAAAAGAKASLPAPRLWLADATLGQVESDGPMPVARMIAGTLAAPVAAPGSDHTELLPASAGGGPPLVQELDADFESIFSPDILLTESGIAYGQSVRGTSWSVAAGMATMGLDYVPVDFDFRGYPTRVDEVRLGLQLDLRQRLLEPLTVLAGANAYDGFADYRSAWINEYWAQQFGDLPGYEAAAPRGEAGRLGLRWEYLPASGYVQLDAAFLKDQIAPGYEIDFDGLHRGRPTLYTQAFGLTTEQVLSPRLRSQLTLRMADTTDRDTRYGGQGWLNWAVAEGWVLRGTGGYTREAPTFEAWFVEAHVEHELARSLWLRLTARHYQDTGEIENSLFSTAAPGLTAWQVGVGVSYTWGASTLRAYVAPYFTDFEPFGLGTAFFGNLYRDRSWGIAQLAYHIEF